MHPSVDIAPISQDVALRQISEIVRDRCRGSNAHIYEAGGGSMSCLPLSSLDNPIITVVDIDETQLKNNDYANSKILGDIQTYSFPPNSFDLIACCNVIEHLDRPDQAIRHFYHALSPGGLLFIAAPNPESLSGIVTKYTPHWFHVWFARVVYRNENAGKPGHHPFPTVFHRVVSPTGLRDFCEKLGFETIHFKLYLGAAHASIRETRPVLGRMLHAATSILNALTFGRRDLRLGDYHAVFCKSAAQLRLDRSCAGVSRNP
jgi:2-polyprenyl-3-methyl-5-hydroxy-6-metoxy-1,4-benzoquinol methylase